MPVPGGPPSAPRPVPGTPPAHPLGVLLLHGFTSSPDGLQALAAPIQALGLPLGLPVLRGHGAASPEALRGIDWPQWLADAEAALAALLLEAERAIVVGHSMGGLLALQLAASHPQAVDSLVLLSPALQLTSPLAPGRPLHGLVPLIRLGFRNWPIPQAYAEPHRAGGDTDYRWAPVTAILALFALAQATQERLPEIRVPTLILQSRRDTVVRPAAAAEILAAIATPADHRRIVWFTRTDHEMLRDCEQEAVVATVLAHLRERLRARRNQAVTPAPG